MIIEINKYKIVYIPAILSQLLTADEGDVCNLWPIMPKWNQVEHASWANIHKHAMKRLVQANKKWVTQIDGNIPGEYLSSMGVA